MDFNVSIEWLKDDEMWMLKIAPKPGPSGLRQIGTSIVLNSPDDLLTLKRAIEDAYGEIVGVTTR